MKKSEILREAKKLLWDGEDIGRELKKEYICNAIESTVIPWEFIPHKILLQSWICRDLIGGDNLDVSLNTWLSVHHPKFVKTNSSMQTIRHKWIDWMITYWQEKGE